jgi:hypothetical protein
MKWNKPPVPVIIVACVYIAVGTIGFVYHFTQLLPLHYDGVLIELTEFVAILCGAYMLRGYNWARWLAVAWIAAHVVLSAFHSFHEFAIHALFCVVITWSLFRVDSARYFRGIEPT